MLLASQDLHREYSHFRSYAEEQWKQPKATQWGGSQRGRTGGLGVDMRQVKGEGGEGRECRAYRASPKNTEGDGFLYYVSLPHPPAPVFHKQWSLATAAVWTLQWQQQARRSAFESGWVRNRSQKSNKTRQTPPCQTLTGQHNDDFRTGDSPESGRWAVLLQHLWHQWWTPLASWLEPQMHSDRDRWLELC